ncbi:MAG: hypothetical protein ABI592_01835 [Acidobacteriota bacterium]
MSIRDAILFFWRVTPVRVYLRVVLFLLPIMAVWAELQTRGASETAVICLLLVQALAVSTGFESHASRGYYDPPLALCSRRRAAAAHFVASALPGVAAWIAIGIVETVAGGGALALAFRPASLLALALVSTLPWAVSVRFGPFTGGVAWLILWGALFLTGRGFRLIPLFQGAEPQGTVLVRTAAGILLPFFLPSAPWRPVELLLFGLTAAGAAATAAGYLGRASFPLRESDS